MKRIKSYLTKLFPITALVMLFFATAAYAQDPTVLDKPLSFVKGFYTAATNGDWTTAAALLLVITVGLIRLYGKKLHELIPDTNPVDKVFYFILETKPGGWLLNFATTLSVAVAGAWSVGQPITWALLKPVVVVALSGAALWELVKDIAGWWTAKKSATAVAAAVEAGGAAAAKPPSDPAAPINK